jgi:hypothetical protein
LVVLVKLNKFKLSSDILNPWVPQGFFIQKETVHDD